MQAQQLLPSKWAQAIAFGIMFLGVAAFAWSGNYLAAAVPFGFLFVLLAGINWKVAYWILLFTIPVSIEISFFGNTLSTSVPDEPIMQMFFLLFFVLLARQPNIIPQWWLRHKIVFIIAAQYLWLLVAVYYSKEPVLSVKFLAAKSWFLVSFIIMPLLIFNKRRDFKIAFLLVLVPLMATVFIIFARHAALGFHFRKVEQAIGDIYFNHVDYSTVISMFFPVLCVALPLTRGRNPIIRGIILFLILFMLPAIYLTYARAALLAVIFAIMVGVAIRLRLVNLIMPVFYGALALMLTYFINNNKYMDLRPDYQHTFMHRDFSDHITATFRGEDMSSMERLYRWIAAMRMSMDEPVKGFGPNSFYYYYKPYGVPSFETYVSRNFEHSTTHNYYLYLLVEQGWPAMLLYAVLIMVVFAVAQKAYHRFAAKKDRFYKYCVLGCVMMFAAGFVNNFFSDLVETHKIGALFFLSIALIIILDQKSKMLEKEGSVD